jgi:hypothetical protein
MIRLLAAVAFLTVAAGPVFACELEKSVSTDTQKRVVGIANLTDVGTNPSLIIECSKDHAAGWTQVS